VNNAGIQHVAPVDEFPVDKWDSILAINLSSAFHTTRTALPSMKARGWGRIVNIASAHGLVASPFKSAYVAAKHGIVGLTKSVALETARLPITCNAICPGYVLTPLVERQIDDQAKVHGIPREAVIEKVILERQPSKEFVKIDDVAELAVFLCGNSRCRNHRSDPFDRRRLGRAIAEDLWSASGPTRLLTGDGIRELPGNVSW
jgi:3-hydroxybutyrate dehydrogenase